MEGSTLGGTSMSRAYRKQTPSFVPFIERVMPQRVMVVREESTWSIFPYRFISQFPQISLVISRWSAPPNLAQRRGKVPLMYLMALSSTGSFFRSRFLWGENRRPECGHKVQVGVPSSSHDCVPQKEGNEEEVGLFREGSSVGGGQEPLQEKWGFLEVQPGGLLKLPAG